MNKYACLLLATFLCIGSALPAQVRFEKKTVVASFASPAGLDAGDLNGDHVPDLAAGSGASGVYAIINDLKNQGRWNSQRVDAGFGACLGVYIADMDQDQQNDIVAGSWDTGEIAWFRNTGDPSTWIRNRITTGFTQPHELFVTDLDLDGDPDVLCAGAGNNTIAWWRNDGGTPAVWTGQVLSNHFMGARSVAAADLDGDGDTDVAGASLTGNEVSLWRNDGGNPIRWTGCTLTSTFTGSHRVQIVDMNQDGKPDILATAYGVNTIAWWENLGSVSGTWNKHVVDNSFQGAVMGAAVDLDLDGDPDVIGTAQPGNRVTWYENTGSQATLWKKTEIETTFAGPWPLCQADFDSDGDPDFAAGGFSAGEIRWYRNVQEGRLTRRLGSGSGSFQVSLFLPPGMQEKTLAYLALPYTGDPMAAPRIRDMILGLTETTGGIVVVPEFPNQGPGLYVPEDPARLGNVLDVCLATLPIHPDSVYLIGFGSNGIESIRTGAAQPSRFKGIISFNPMVPVLGDLGMSYPDLPVCLCSGTLHPDRANHAELISRISGNHGKGQMIDLQDIAEEVLVGDLPERLLDCKNYIDTVRGQSMRVDYGEINSSIKIFPNPSSGRFTVQLPEQIAGPIEIEVFSMAGMKMTELSFSPQEKQVLTLKNHLPDGLYLISVRGSNHQVWRQRLVVLRK